MMFVGWVSVQRGKQFSWLRNGVLCPHNSKQHIRTTEKMLKSSMVLPTHLHTANTVTRKKHPFSDLFSRQITTPAPLHSVLWAGCSFSRPTSSVKALKANTVLKKIMQIQAQSLTVCKHSFSLYLLMKTLWQLWYHFLLQKSYQFTQFLILLYSGFWLHQQQRYFEKSTSVENHSYT